MHPREQSRGYYILGSQPQPDLSAEKARETWLSSLDSSLVSNSTQRKGSLFTSPYPNILPTQFSFQHPSGDYAFKSSIFVGLHLGVSYARFVTAFKMTVALCYSPHAGLHAQCQFWCEWESRDSNSRAAASSQLSPTSDGIYGFETQNYKRILKCLPPPPV